MQYLRLFFFPIQLVFTSSLVLVVTCVYIMGLDIGVTEKLLNRSNVVAFFQYRCVAKLCLNFWMMNIFESLHTAMPFEYCAGGYCDSGDVA